MSIYEVRNYRIAPRISGARACAYMYTRAALRVFALCAGFVFFCERLIASPSSPVLKDLVATPSISELVAGISLSNYPNPFDSRVTTTRIVIKRPASALSAAAVSVTIYDVFGIPVRTYGRVEQDSVVWDGRDDEGRHVAKGGYICVVSTAEGRIAALTKIGVIH